MITDTSTPGKPARAHPPPNPVPIDILAAQSDPGAYVLGFGKFKRARLADVPDYYLHWLATGAWCPHLRELVARVLDERELIAEEGALPELPSAPAAAVLPRLLLEWDERMRAAFKGDGWALGVVERGLEELRQIAADLIDNTNGPAAEGGQRG